MNKGCFCLYFVYAFLMFLFQNVFLILFDFYYFLTFIIFLVFCCFCFYFLFWFLWFFWHLYFLIFTDNGRKIVIINSNRNCGGFYSMYNIHWTHSMTLQQKKTRHYRTGHIVHWPRLGGLTAYVSHTVLVGLIVCLPIEKSERNQVFCVVQFALMMFDKTVCQRISCYGSLATTRVLHVTQVKTLWLRRVIVFAGIYVKLFQSSVL